MQLSLDLQRSMFRLAGIRAPPATECAMTVNEGAVQPAVRPAARGAVCLIYVIAAAKSRHHPAPNPICGGRGEGI